MYSQLTFFIKLAQNTVLRADYFRASKGADCTGNKHTNSHLY